MEGRDAPLSDIINLCVAKKGIKLMLRLTVGIPGSGKSTVCLEWLQSGEIDTIVNPDSIRMELTGNPSDQTVNHKVWDLAYERTLQALMDGDRVALDATNLVPKNRAKFVKLGLKYPPLEAHMFTNVSFQECMERNNNRSRVVPESAMLRMFEQQQLYCSVEQLEQEGFTVYLT